MVQVGYYAQEKKLVGNEAGHTEYRCRGFESFCLLVHTKIEIVLEKEEEEEKRRRIKL
jgi:hypothetical protein